MKKLFIYFWLVAFSTQSLAQSILYDSEETRVTQGFQFIPYGFSSDSFGLGLGLAGGTAGWPAEETSYFVATTVGSSGSYNIILSSVDLPVPGTLSLKVSGQGPMTPIRKTG